MESRAGCEIIPACFFEPQRDSRTARSTCTGAWWRTCASAGACSSAGPLYLGELNDSQRAEWQRAVEALGDDGKVHQLKLFPEDRAPETDDGQVVRIRMDRLTVRNARNWGEVWLGTELWDRLGLDGFWRARLPPSRKGTDWLASLKTIVMYRLADPGSELSMHANWLANTAVE